MLKILRTGAIENPWFFRIIMFLIALTFVISMGWWGFQTDQEQSYVAQIDEHRIGRVEYDRYKENAYRYYRDLFKENFQEDFVKQFVINTLVERRLWLKLSNQMGVTIGRDELREGIMRDPSFQNAQGRFDPERYQFVLSRSRQSASVYEQSIREELTIGKTRQIIMDGIVLAEREIKEARETVKDPKLTPEKRAEEEAKAVASALERKQQRLVSAAINQIRGASHIEIKSQLL